MARKKLKKFAELANFPSVLQNPEGKAGTWPQPLIAELGCGYGEYTLALAERYPQFHYVGMDIQGERLWKGVTKATELKLNNVWWLRGMVDHLPTYFAPGELSEIWLTFPDPQLRKSNARKRLTAPRFLEYYKTLLKPGGRVHLKTDSASLIEFTKETVPASGATIDRVNDAVALGEPEFDLDIVTRFERKHRKLGDQIHYLSWHW